jgi:hypothetical protein
MAHGAGHRLGGEGQHFGHLVADGRRLRQVGFAYASGVQGFVDIDGCRIVIDPNDGDGISIDDAGDVVTGKLDVAASINHVRPTGDGSEHHVGRKFRTLTRTSPRRKRFLLVDPAAYTDDPHQLRW